MSIFLSFILGLIGGSLGMELYWRYKAKKAVDEFTDAWARFDEEVRSAYEEIAELDFDKVPEQETVKKFRN